MLTLDLVSKGYRYAEVPITYGFRQHGQSFVPLGPYLRSVLTAVRRELRTATAAGHDGSAADTAVDPAPVLVADASSSTY